MVNNQRIINAYYHDAGFLMEMLWISFIFMIRPIHVRLDEITSFERL